ncbi:hypothetical protein ACFL1B_00725 [Nanoarchaeota archaeon]
MEISDDMDISDLQMHLIEKLVEGDYGPLVLLCPNSTLSNLSELEKIAGVPVVVTNETETFTEPPMPGDNTFYVVESRAISGPYALISTVKEWAFDGLMNGFNGFLAVFSDHYLFEIDKEGEEEEEKDDKEIKNQQMLKDLEVPLQIPGYMLRLNELIESD